MHAAEDQHAVPVAVAGTQTEHVGLAPLMGEVGNGDQLGGRRVGGRQTLYRGFDFIDVEVSHGTYSLRPSPRGIVPSRVA